MASLTERRKVHRTRPVKEVEAEIAQAKASAKDATGVKRAQAEQKILNLEQELTFFRRTDGFEELRKSALKVLKSYSDDKHITAQAWIRAGVPERDLREAGML